MKIFAGILAAAMRYAVALGVGISTASTRHQALLAQTGCRRTPGTT